MITLCNRQWVKKIALIGSLLMPAMPAAVYGCDLTSETFFAQADVEEAIRCIKIDKNVNVRNLLGMTPLHIAVNSPPKVIAALINAGAKVNSRTPQGFTPLNWAARHNARAAIAVLLAAGAKVNSRDEVGLTPLHWLIFANAEPETLETLIDAGADLNSRNHEGFTPLHLAYINNSDPDTIEILIEAGANVVAADKSGRIPIDYLRK